MVPGGETVPVVRCSGVPLPVLSLVTTVEEIPSLMSSLITMCFHTISTCTRSTTPGAWPPFWLGTGCSISFVQCLWINVSIALYNALFEFFFWGNNSSITFLFDVLKTKLSHESHKKKVAIYICLQVCIIARSNSKFNIYQNPSFWCKNLWHWECDFTIKYNTKHENLKEGTSPTTRSWELLSLQDLCKR